MNQSFLILALVSLSMQYSLETDYRNNSVLLIPNGKLYILDKEITITYSIDISILNKIKGISAVSSENCMNALEERVQYNKRLFDLQYIINHNRIREYKQDMIITNTFSYLRNLEEDAEIYRKLNKTSCYAYRHIVSHLSKIFYEIQKLSASDFWKIIFPPSKDSNLRFEKRRNSINKKTFINKIYTLRLSF